MIITGSHDNWKSNQFLTYTITDDLGLSINYKGKSYLDLVPKQEFSSKSYDNEGVSGYRNNKHYIRQFYLNVLKDLDPEKVYRDLDFSVLLSYEDNMELSNRHIVAAWLELFLDVQIREAKIDNNRIVFIDKPRYIKDYLEEFIINSTKMKGFKSLRALYLFEKANKMEEISQQVEKEYGMVYNGYRRVINGLREEAQEIECKGKNKVLSII